MTFLQRHLGNRRLQEMAPTDGPVVQRACACGGTCAHCADHDEEPRLQPKLRVGAPHDRYEREADRVADHVTRTSAATLAGQQAASPLDIQRLSDGSSTSHGETGLALPGEGGHPLSPQVRDFMEPRFGVDFSPVRLHTGAEAEQAADRLQARAFTYGQNIWLGRGAAEGDRHLMAHELTHTVQQGITGGDSGAGSRLSPTSSRIQREQRRQCPGGTKTVMVDLVSLEASSRNPLDDLDFANQVFQPCCVQFVVGRGVSVDPALSDSWLGGDTVMSRITAPDRVHAEEAAVFDDATVLFGLSGRLRVFYVDAISPAARATSRPAVWATGRAAPYEGMATVTNGAVPRSLAHEFGHILLNETGATHTTHAGGTDNLMEPSNTSTGENLEPAQCTTIFSNV